MTSTSTATSEGVRTVESATATIRFKSGMAQNDADSDSCSSSAPDVDVLSDMMSVSPQSLNNGRRCTYKHQRAASPPRLLNLQATDTDRQSNDLVPNATALAVAEGTQCHGSDAEVVPASPEGHRDGHPSVYSGVDSRDSGCPCSPLETEPTATSTEAATNTAKSPSDKSDTHHCEIKHDEDSSDDAVKEPVAAELASPSKSLRFNPFDKDDTECQDPFPQLNSPTSPSAAVYRRSGSWTDSLEGGSPTGFMKSSASVDLGLSEDHFSQPEGSFGLSTLEELELAVENCKQLIMIAESSSLEKQDLVHKLIQLRLKLTEAKEASPEVDPDVKMTVGHRFVTRDSNSKRYCEQCSSVIWGVVQQWYKCTHCGFCCHDKCLNLITRTCASVKVADNPQYILDICPERSLAAQNYKCAECRSNLSFNPTLRDREPRQCDYTGNFYCNHCHWNDAMVVPARVLHNWDFEPRKVCRATKQLLRLLFKKAVIRVQDVNPMLFNFVEELNEVKKLREEILIMKKYFLACKDALESKLLLQLRERQHFVENSDMYSLHDLVDTANDMLLPKLAKVHASFAQHIKTDCKRCQVKGYICELCDEKEVLFPFDSIATVCAQCSTVLHRHCYMRRNQKCPKCERISQRQATAAMETRPC